MPEDRIKWRQFVTSPKRRRRRIINTVQNVTKCTLVHRVMIFMAKYQSMTEKKVRAEAAQFINPALL